MYIKKFLITVGTSSKVINMMSLFKAFLKKANFFETKVCITTQRNLMLNQALDFFEFVPDVDLDLMKFYQNHYSLTADIKSFLKEIKRDIVYLYSDIMTTMAPSIKSFHTRAMIYHVESGSRIFKKRLPYPEEINRSVIKCIAGYHFLTYNHLEAVLN
jgi:UDP-N-acetylglucosamine 2-epimerase (non-hydrolysing)